MGRSQFIDDIPKPNNLLYVKVFVSPVACGIMKTLDTKEASEMPGVVAVLTAKDIPGENQIGGIIKDEVCLANGHVQFIGEPVAIVAAESRSEAEAALLKIRLEVEEETPVLTIREAIKKEQYVGAVRKIERGDVESVFAGLSLLSGRCDS